MRASLRKPLTFALAALYLLAVAAAGRFHAHRDSPDDGCGGHGGVACCPGGPAGGPSHVPQSAPGLVHSADECPVCQFLAQKLVPPKAEQSGGWQRLFGRPPAAEPARPVLGFLLIERSRAPPSCV